MFAPTRNRRPKQNRGLLDAKAIGWNAHRRTPPSLASCREVDRILATPHWHQFRSESPVGDGLFSFIRCNDISTARPVVVSTTQGIFRHFPPSESVSPDADCTKGLFLREIVIVINAINNIPDRVANSGKHIVVQNSSSRLPRSIKNTMASLRLALSL